MKINLILLQALLISLLWYSKKFPFPRFFFFFNKMNVLNIVSLEILLYLLLLQHHVATQIFTFIGRQKC